MGSFLPEDHLLSVPHATPVVDSCMLCALRNGNFFCALPPASLKALERITHAIWYPEDTVVFSEGEDSWGVYIVCKGKVKLQTANEGDKAHVFRIAQPGDVLGLKSTITKEPYKLTAESATPVQLGFVGRKDFGRFLRSHGEACLAAARQLNRNGDASPHIVPSVCLSHAMTERFAKLLLRWSADQTETHEPSQIRMAFKHEDLAHSMGCSKATVSQLLSCFQSSKILEINHSSLRILNRVELERFIGT